MDILVNILAGAGTLVWWIFVCAFWLAIWFVFPTSVVAFFISERAIKWDWVDHFEEKYEEPHNLTRKDLDFEDWVDVWCHAVPISALIAVCLAILYFIGTAVRG